MENRLYSLEDVISFIKKGLVLSLAGDVEILKKLPSGNWIGGSTPYFMDENGGKFTQDMIFVTHIKTYDNEFKIDFYDDEDINQIVEDSYDNGYTILLIPPFQKVHEAYAVQTEDLDGLYNNPIVGWVAGVDFNSNDVPKIFYGPNGKSYDKKATAIHVKLPENLFAQIDIVNIFESESKNDEIRFYEDGFSASRCLVNGVDTDFPKYLREHSIDTKLPLVSEYLGVPINVCLNKIDVRSVSFLAPVFKSKTYKFAKDVANYVTEFENHTHDLHSDNVFSCNCVLNYLYGELKDEKIKNATGPFVFGEIGYKLLNQTLVNLYISEQ